MASGYQGLTNDQMLQYGENASDATKILHIQENSSIEKSAIKLPLGLRLLQSAQKYEGWSYDTPPGQDYPPYDLTPRKFKCNHLINQALWDMGYQAGNRTSEAPTATRYYEGYPSLFRRIELGEVDSLAKLGRAVHSGTIKLEVGDLLASPTYDSRQGHVALFYSAETDPIRDRDKDRIKLWTFDANASDRKVGYHLTGTHWSLNIPIRVYRMCVSE